MKALGRVVRGGRKFWAEEHGPTITEYAVLLVLIVFGVFGVITLIGVFIKDTFTSVSDGLPES